MSKVREALHKRDKKRHDFFMQMCSYVRYGMFHFKQQLVSKDQTTILSWNNRPAAHDVKFALTVNGMQLACWSKAADFFNWPTPAAEELYGIDKLSSILQEFFLDWFHTDKTGGEWQSMIVREGGKGFRIEHTDDDMYELGSWLHGVGIFSNFLTKVEWDLGFFLIKVDQKNFTFSAYLRLPGAELDEHLFDYCVVPGAAKHVSTQRSNKVNTKIMTCIMSSFYTHVRTHWHDSGRLDKEPPVIYMVAGNQRFVTPAWIMWAELNDARGRPSTLTQLTVDGVQRALQQLEQRRPAPEGSRYEARIKDMKTRQFEIVEIKEEVICY